MSKFSHCSRAVREGTFCGKRNGVAMRGHGPHREVFSANDKCHFANRKAWKAALMEVRNSTRQQSYGGHINFN